MKNEQFNKEYHDCILKSVGNRLGHVLCFFEKHKFDIHENFSDLEAIVTILNDDIELIRKFSEKNEVYKVIYEDINAELMYKDFKQLVEFVKSYSYLLKTW